MKGKPIRARLAAAAIVVLMGWSAPSRAANILYNQPWDGNPQAIPAQLFTDTTPVNYTAWNTQGFDDFTVPAGGWIVTGATFYGQDQGDPTTNVSINMQFLSAPGLTTSGISGGSEVFTGDPNNPLNSNLVFTGLNVFLAPGTYWIDGWVVRPELPTGGQWFWYTTDVNKPFGSEYLIQNPGGKQLFDANDNPLAPTPTPGSVVYGLDPSDLAFTLVGFAVPEPSGAVLLAVGGLAVAIVARWRR
jgi:hypothetical protein